MARSIAGWMKKKNLRAISETRMSKDHYKQKPMTFEQTGFAMAMGLKKKGIRGNSFFDNAYASVMPGLAPALAKALQQDVAEIMRVLVVKRGEIQ